MEFVYVARVDFIGREPLDIANIQIELRFRLYSGFNLFVQDLAFVFVEFFGEYSDDPVTLFTFEGKEDNERVLREAHVQTLMAHPPIKLHIGNIKDSFERAAFEGEPQSMPNQTLRTVAANKIFRRDSP